ncbi:hypothetical protein BDY24DRAFT_381758 [Mrakia frigida]|uniref:uncharacterized protein n=1 Tax=Mrakia frigida TaxID=29902 RepID=UPI003FCC1A5A
MLLLPFTLLSTLLVGSSSVQAASSCAVFDANFDLYVFGGTNDVKLGAQSTWAAPTVENLTSTGRPPYTGPSLTCYLSQSLNALYLLGGSSSSPSDIYIYSFSSSSWSIQPTSSAPDFTASSTGSVLDHDTNTFFTLAGGTALSQLDLSAGTDQGTGGTLAWEGVNTAPFESSSYNPTMALASNHIMYLGAPGVAAGSAEIFVIHYAAWQAEPQTFPTLNSGTAFPSSHGQATSFFLASGDAQLQFAFVDDAFTNTFILTHWTSPSTAGSTDGAPSGISPYLNSTQLLPAPSQQDTGATYAASATDLVQLTSTGELYYLTVLGSSSEVGGYAVESGATWTKIGYAVGGGSGSSTAAAGASASASAGGSASASGSGVAASASASASASAAAASASSTTSTGGAQRESSRTMGGAGVLLGLVAWLVL